MRLIDADALISDLEHDVKRDTAVLDTLTLDRISRENIQFDKDWKQNAVDLLMRAPTVEPERKTGEWILDEDPHDGDCRCSACLMAIGQLHERNHGLLNALTGGKWWTFYKFCPNCGSYNGGEQSEAD